MGDDITIGVTEIVNNIEVTAQPNDQIVDISVIDNADEVTLNITPTVIEINVNKGSSYARWGTIYGNLTDQTDLTNALILKADLVDGKVPAYQLPSFVDDVVEVANYAALPATGETGKIYVTLDNNKIYRWSGSVYIEIASNSAIWGAITGTLSNQTDLQNALNLKQNSLSWMSPLSVAGGTVSISYSGVSTNGALSSTDWNTFNGKANDNEVVHLAGTETITGSKTFTDSRTTFQNADFAQIRFKNTTDLTKYLDIGYGSNGNMFSKTGLDFRVGGLTTAALSIASNENATFRANVTANSFTNVNASTGIGFNSTNSSSGKGFESTNSSTGQGFYSYNSGLGTGIYSTNTAAGKGIQCYNSSTGTGFYSNNSAGGIALYSNNESSGRNLLLNNTTTATGMPFTIQKQGVDKFTINDAGGVYAAGSVGIGTTSPGTTTANTLLGFVNGSNIQARTAVPQIAMSSNIDGDWYSPTYKTTAPAAQIIADGYYGNISFRTAPSGTAGNAITWNGAAIYIQNDSKVGIGTTSPSTKLHVGDGTNTGSQYLRVQGSGSDIFIGESGGTLFGFSPRSAGYVISDNSTNPFLIGVVYSQPLVFGTANTERMRITSGGNVGIGTSSPGVSLEVNGLIRSIPVYNNTTATAANLVVSSGGTFERSTSSLKYKKEVRDYDKGLETLLQIRPVYYKGKSESDGDKQFAGLIAEEIHELGLTEFVQYAEDETPDALAYTHMVALLVKSIQEQNVMLQELKAEIELLKAN